MERRIHGIQPQEVADAAGWGEQLDRLCAFAGADVLVAHNAGFDMNVIRRACEASDDDCPPYSSLCSLAVARGSYDLDSYRLPVAAAAAGFGAFPHHDALADARACAQIVIDAGAAHRHPRRSARIAPEAVGRAGSRLRSARLPHPRAGVGATSITRVAA